MSNRPVVHSSPGKFDIICHRSMPHRYPEESHSELQICIPLENALYTVRRITETGRRQIGYLGPRDILAVPTGQPHLVDWQRQADIVSLNLSDSFLFDALELPQLTVGDTFTLRDPLVSSIAAEVRNTAFAGDVIGSAYAEALVTLVAFRVGIAARARIRPTGVVRPFPAPRRARIENFIETNLDKSISLSMLAASEGLSIWHFMRRFSASYGASPHEFITARRLARARELLARPDLSVTAIALEVGMSPSNFSRNFARRFGISPRTFREKITL